MTADAQLVYSRRQGKTYRISTAALDIIALGQLGNFGNRVWWYEGDEIVGFEFVPEYELSWIECSDQLNQEWQEREQLIRLNFWAERDRAAQQYKERLEAIRAEWETNLVWHPLSWTEGKHTRAALYG